MVENNEELKMPIGTEEARVYKPGKVTIVDVSVWTSDKGNKKYECHVKHPESEDPIKLSSVKYINPVSQKVEVSGLWINKDSEDKLKKNSAAAVFLKYMNCQTFEELKGKEAEAVEGDSKYLAFKSY